MEVSIAIIHVNKSAILNTTAPIIAPAYFQLLVCEDRKLHHQTHQNPAGLQQPHEKKKRSTVAGSRNCVLALPYENVNYDAGSSIEDSICSVLSEQVRFPIRRITRVDTWTTQRRRKNLLQPHTTIESTSNEQCDEVQKEATYGKALMCIPANKEEYAKYLESFENSKWESLQTIHNLHTNGVVGSEHIMNFILELEDWLHDMQKYNRHFIYDFFTKCPAKDRIIYPVHNPAYSDYETPSTSELDSECNETEKVDEIVQNKHMLRVQMIKIDKCEDFFINSLFENPLATHILDSVKYYYNNMDSDLQSSSNPYTDYSDRYPLHDAATKKIPKERMEKLCELYDPNEVDGSNKTPLHYAAQKGLIDNAMAIIESKYFFQINAQDRKGNTPLHLAVKMEHEHLVNLLLKHPAIIKDIENKNGMSPADYCRNQVTAVFQRMYKDLRNKGVPNKKLTVRSAGGTWYVLKLKENEMGELTHQPKTLRMILDEDIAADKQLGELDKNVLSFFLKSENLQLPIRLSEVPSDKLDAKRWNLTIAAYRGIRFTQEEPCIYLGRNPFITLEEEQKANLQNKFVRDILYDDARKAFLHGYLVSSDKDKKEENRKLLAWPKRSKFKIFEMGAIYALISTEEYNASKPPDYTRYMPKYILDSKTIKENKAELFKKSYKENGPKSHDDLKERFIYLARLYPTYGATFYSCAFSIKDKNDPMKRRRRRAHVGINVNGVHLLFEYSNEWWRESFAFADMKSSASGDILQLIVNNNGITQDPISIETKFADLLMHYIHQYRKKLNLQR